MGRITSGDRGRRGWALALAAVLSVSVVSGVALSRAQASPPEAATASPAARSSATEKSPVAVGWGGAVASVDADATAAGLAVLRRGGNAVDAAVATAAALGVTEPYSAGIGGGGYFVYYDARAKRVRTIDGRETAPAGITPEAFIDPATGEPYDFTPELVTSGVSVGVPGTPATWEQAVQRWGRRSLAANLQPAIDLARDGFVVDPTFTQQTADNQERFAAFTSTSALYLPGGAPPAPGTTLKNPDLAATYEALARQGSRAIYRGPIAAEIVEAVQRPPKTSTTTLPVPAGSMTTRDLASYETELQAPTKVSYRGLDVYGMAPSSSGGTTVGEALNILDNFRLDKVSRAQALHYYLEASALAFADRGAYVGDPAFVDVPTRELLSQGFANSRACTIDPDQAMAKPTAAGTIGDRRCDPATAARPLDQGTSTTHLVTSDRWGNVVSYTLTIEQTGGSGIVVPGRGFLLNNELTDFTTVYDASDPNRIEPGKRPRSSMSPTIVFRHGKPFLALGSPGGSTIITTVLQTLINRIDLDMGLYQAVAAPRAAQRNTATVTAEPAFIDAYQDALTPYGHQLVPSGDSFTSAAEIGAVAALEFYPGGLVQAVAEPARRGGGSAGVVSQDP